MFVTIEAFKPQDVELFLNTHLQSDPTNKINYELHIVDQLKRFDKKFKEFFDKGGVFNFDKFREDTMLELQDERDHIIENIGRDMSDYGMFDRIEKRHLKIAFDTVPLKLEIDKLDVIEVIKKSVRENYKNTYINWDNLNYEKLYRELFGYEYSNNTLISKVLTETNYGGFTYNSGSNINYESSLRNLVIMALTL